MLRGVDILANAVKVTLGPKGRNVVLDKSYRRAADHQGRGHRRQGDRALRQVREHGRADGQGGRLQDQRPGRRRHHHRDRAGPGDRARRRQGGGRRDEPDGSEARHRPGRRSGRRGHQEALEEDLDQRRDRPGRHDLGQWRPRDRRHDRQGDAEGRQRGRDHGRRGQEPRDRARRRRGHAVRPRLSLALFRHQRREDGRRARRSLHPAAREEAVRACRRCCRCSRRWCRAASRC